MGTDERGPVEAGPELPGSAGASPRTAAVDRLPRVLTEALAPANAVALTVVVVAVTEAGLVQGLLWSLLTLAFVPGFPLVVLALGVRRQWWSDRHVRVRRQRLVPLTVALASLVACLLVLTAVGAPARLGALLVSMTAGLGVTLAVTLVWKVSVHAACAAGSAVVLAVELGLPWGLLAAAATVAVGWSRCRLGHHTPAQVLVGTALGAAVAAGLYGTLAAKAVTGA